MRKANILQFLYASFVLTCKHLYTIIYCNHVSLRASDLEALLDCILEIMRALFAMILIDAEAFKHLAQSQKSTFLFDCTIFMVLFTKIMDNGKDNITDEAVQAALSSFSEEQESQTKVSAESCLQQLLQLLTLISERDVETRRSFGERHVLEDASKLEEHMRSALATQAGSSLFHALCGTPTRFFKASKLVLCASFV